MHTVFERASKGSQLYSRKDDLLKTLICERLYFGKDILRLCASSRSTHLGDNAVGTAGITSILQLDQWPGFSPGMRHGRQRAIALCSERRANYFALHRRIAIFEELSQTFFGGVS